MASKAPKEEKENAMAEKTGEKKETQETGGYSTPALKHKKESRWNLELCLRYAKRFQTREEWQQGHPSSFKSAMARGFEKQCMAHMKPFAAKKAASAPKTKAPARMKKSA